MSKKFFIILISVVLVVFLVILIGYYFILTGGNSNGTTSTGKGLFSFLPFGQSTTPVNTTVATSTETSGQLPLNLTNFNVKLRELSAEPVAGAGTLDVNIGTSTKSTVLGTVVRYIEKATGHIFEVQLYSPVQNRISNTTVPQVYNAIWGNKNNLLIAQYIKSDDETVDTYALTLKPTLTTVATSTMDADTVSAVLFPINISDISVFGSSIFYLQQNQNSSIGDIASFDGKTRRQIWSSPIREFNSQFVNANTVALTTSPEENVPGFLYTINTTSGAVKNILSNIPGLSTLVSPDANQVLYLAQGSIAQLSILNQKVKLNRTITPATFPEKCVWSKKNTSTVYCAVPEQSLSGGSLIAWYKGLTSFSDDIWKYDVINGTATIIENLSNDAGEQIDVVKPILSDNEQYLVFVNKRDGTLWSLDLTK